MRKLWVVPLLLVLGCAKVTMNVSCAATATGVAFALSGSTVGATALSMLGGVATKAGVMAAPNEPQPTSATMTYEYLPIFGADGGSLTCSQPPQTTVVVTSPPASVIRQ